MEEYLSTLSKTLGSFCNHIDSTCAALKQSVDRRPIPLDSASSTFIKCLNRKISTASSDLNLLDSMTFGTVSFEELLGHCSEVYKKNEADLALIEDQLRSSGYVRETEIEEEVKVASEFSSSSILDSKLTDPRDGLDSPGSCGVRFVTAGSVLRNLEEDPLLEVSLSLKNLGISEVSLASLASEATGKFDELDISVQGSKTQYGDEVDDLRGKYQPATRNWGVTEERENFVFGHVEDNLKTVVAPTDALTVSKEDYECIPSSIKSLASWEDLLAAVEKINLRLNQKEKTKGSYFFLQDEISSLELGPKARCYLLLLLRMNRLVVETIDGRISYRVL